MYISAQKKLLLTLGFIAAGAIPTIAIAEPSSPMQVEIKRDGYRAPHVFAETNYGLF